MTADTAKTVIAKAFDYAGTGNDARIAFSFQGGEPLLAGLPFFRFFADAVKKENKSHIPVDYALQTNGILLDDAFAASVISVAIITMTSPPSPFIAFTVFPVSAFGAGS